jgi:heme exporter protein D
MSWLYISASQLGLVIAVIYTLRQHRKMLAYLAQHIQLIEKALTQGDNK